MSELYYKDWIRDNDNPSFYRLPADTSQRWTLSVVAYMKWDRDDTKYVLHLTKPTLLIKWKPYINYYCGNNNGYPYGNFSNLSFDTAEQAMDACDKEWDRLVSEDEDVQKLLKDFEEK